MENSLAKYMGKNYKDTITNLEVCQGTARETGTPYFYITIAFVNGYVKRLYLKQEEQFAWTNAFDTLEVSNQILGD